MKTLLAVVLVAVAACAGYWAGFRTAWTMGMSADAAPRGTIAVYQLRLLERGRLNDVKLGLEHDVDMGLINWHGLLASPVSPVINVLSGYDVMPEYERYVRRLATYRKNHKSSRSTSARQSRVRRRYWECRC